MRAGRSPAEDGDAVADVRVVGKTPRPQFSITRSSVASQGLTRRRLLAAGGGLMCALAGGRAAAQDIQFFRLATGTTGGTYFPIGGLIANAISKPPGARPCERGGSCGVTGLIAVAQATIGSVENIEMLRTGMVEAGMVQADIAHWAYSGTGPYEGKPPFDALRSMGTLYAEAIHVVARVERGIETVADLRGRTVSVGEEGSGTLVDARLILAAYGLEEKDLASRHLKPGTAADRLVRGELDAFFMVGGTPVAAVRDAADQMPIRILPIDGAVSEELRRRHRFFSAVTIPAETYAGVPPIQTLGVGAEILVRADRDPELIYRVTRALWHENTLKILADGHPRGRSIDPRAALAAVAVPIHPGAQRYYREVGLLGVDRASNP